MEIKEINNFLEEMNTIWKKREPKVFNDIEKLTFIRLSKLSEEVGELNEAVLAKYNFQRKEKNSKFDENSISEELVDVIITSFNIAYAQGLDLEPIIKKKMEKIKKRFQ